jgi:SAM-dependent methyltransferase
MKYQFDLNKRINTVVDLFNASMDRNCSEIYPTPEGNILNLGAGNKEFPWAIPLQLPDWNGEKDSIPYPDESIDAIYAFHFLEHLTARGLYFTLSECERVLKKYAVMTICVPHRLGGIAYQDLDHKLFFTENTWRTLFENEYYKTRNRNIDMRIRFNLIMGDSERTLVLITQLQKWKS